MEQRNTLPLPDDAALAAVAGALHDAGQWAEIIDRDWRYVYMTDDFRLSMGGVAELAPVPVGAHVFGSEAAKSVPGPEGLSRAAEGVSEMVGKAKAAAQAPMHTVRGSGEQEKMLHNARVEYQQEAHEIATYTVIDSLATAAGDKQTAKLARDILRQEVRTQDFLAGLLPKLSVDVAHDEIPASEINGPAARVTAGAQTGAKASGGSKSGAGRSKASSRSSRSSSRSKAKA